MSKDTPNHLPKMFPLALGGGCLRGEAGAMARLPMRDKRSGLPSGIGFRRRSRERQGVGLQHG